jgi:hypothetical protein
VSRSLVADIFGGIVDVLVGLCEALGSDTLVRLESTGGHGNGVQCLILCVYLV